MTALVPQVEVRRIAAPPALGSSVFRNGDSGVSTSAAGRFIDGLRAAPVVPLVPAPRRFSELWFELMARNRPSEVLDEVRQESIRNDPVLVARAALAFSASRTSDVHVVAWLETLLDHERPFVRESAVYGLESSLSSRPDLLERIDTIAAKDLSPGVRAAAAEVSERARAA